MSSLFWAAVSLLVTLYLADAIWSFILSLESKAPWLGQAAMGLVGIVVPYMLPLVLLLVALEESGIMHRVAFVVDRGFHRIGLHGGVAAPFLVGLGCNVPAISMVAISACPTCLRRLAHARRAKSAKTN